MKVKQLIEELQKLDPEFELLAKAPDTGYNTVVEVKPITVVPFAFHGSSYYSCDYVHDLNGYVAYEIAAKKIR
jgi:hypothetical protein